MGAAGGAGASFIVGTTWMTIVCAATIPGARWLKARAPLSCRKLLLQRRMPVSTLTRPPALMGLVHTSQCPTRAKPRTHSSQWQVGTMTLRFSRLHFTRGVAPSVKSTTLATFAMASLECAVASNDGASSNVAPQHSPTAVDTTAVQSQVEALRAAPG